MSESSLNLTVDNQTDILSLNMRYQNIDSQRMENEVDKFDDQNISVVSAIQTNRNHEVLSVSYWPNN